jgi:hypothetical protein
MKDIMVTDHQMHINHRNILSPPLEPAVFQVGTTVKQVTNNDECFRFEKLDLLPEALKVFLINICRDRDAGSPEMAGFAEMKIRYDDGFLRFPIQAAFGRKPELLVL